MTSAAEPPKGPVDEFDWIDLCLRPLAAGAPEALNLMDDVALVPSRPGFDLVVSKDAMVEGVHFLPDDPLDGVAGKLLRVNLSDLAAKGAEPYAYLLATAWSPRCGWPERRAFAAGLAADQSRFGLRLIGGDTVSSPGPATFSLTIFGWVPAGGLVRRSGARVGDAVLVTGTIGDGFLGLEAAQGGLGALTATQRAALADRYRRPQPRLGLGPALRAHASAAADVSDGLIADAGHIAAASGVQITLDLDQSPLSEAAAAWLAQSADAKAARLALAAGGDDYEVICTAPQAEVAALQAAAKAVGLPLTRIGQVQAGQGVACRLGGRLVSPPRAGYRHR